MKKLGWLGWGLVGLGGLVAILAGALFFLMSRLDTRAEIERAVERATGRDLTIAGEVGVSLFPVIGLRAEQASLANVTGGRAAALAEMDEIDIGVEIAPLLRREVVVRNLVLKRPRIFLEVNAQGEPNWVLTPQAPAGAPAPAPGTQPPPPPPFRLREMRTVDGEAHYSDARSNTGWEISESNLRTAFDGMDQPVRVRGSLIYGGERVGLDVTLQDPRAVIAGEPTALRARIDSPLVEADFEGRTTANAGEVSGTVSASGPSLRRLASWLGSPLEGGYGFQNFVVSGRLDVAPRQLAFANAAFSLDALSGRGDFQIIARPQRPYVSGRLEVFEADFNPYITGRPAAPPAAESAATNQIPGDQAATAEAALAPQRALDVKSAPSEVAIDFSGLKAVDCDLQLTTHAMRVQQMKIDGAELGLVLNDGFLAATLHRLTLYGGNGRGRVELDARTSEVTILQDLAFDSIDARAFLTDAANFSNIEGEAEISLTLRTRGVSQSSLIAGADGRAHIEVVSGGLRGVDLGGVSRTIANAISGDLVAPTARTPFTGFSATFALADGVLASDNLSFNTPELVIRGLGLINLSTQRLDARLAPRSAGSSIVVPFSVRGPFADLGYESDMLGRNQRDLAARVNAIKTAARAP